MRLGTIGSVPRDQEVSPARRGYRRRPPLRSITAHDQVIVPVQADADRRIWSPIGLSLPWPASGDRGPRRGAGADRRATPPGSLLGRRLARSVSDLLRIDAAGPNEPDHGSGCAQRPRDYSPGAPVSRHAFDTNHEWLFVADLRPVGSAPGSSALEFDLPCHTVVGPPQTAKGWVRDWNVEAGDPINGYGSPPPPAGDISRPEHYRVGSRARIPDGPRAGTIHRWRSALDRRTHP